MSTLKLNVLYYGMDYFILQEVFLVEIKIRKFLMNRPIFRNIFRNLSTHTHGNKFPNSVGEYYF